MDDPASATRRVAYLTKDAKWERIGVSVLAYHAGKIENLFSFQCIPNRLIISYYDFNNIELHSYFWRSNKECVSSQKCDNGICTIKSCKSSRGCFPSEKCKGIKGRDVGMCFPTNCKDHDDCMGSQKCAKGICTVRSCKSSKECLIPFERCNPRDDLQDDGMCFPTPCKVDEGINPISFE